MIIVKEADYKSINNILNDNSIYHSLSIDNANMIISDISDNLYNLNNKLEALGRIGKHTGSKKVSELTDNITEALNSIFDSRLWQELLEEFEGLD